MSILRMMKNSMTIREILSSLMSRIDISIINKASNKLIYNRGFCRDIHLQMFCDENPDEEVRTFANELYLGIELEETKLYEFKLKLIHSIQKLEQQFVYKSDTLPQYKREALQRFRQNLTEALSFVEELENDPFLPKYKLYKGRLILNVLHLTKNTQL